MVEEIKSDKEYRCEICNRKHSRLEWAKDCEKGCKEDKNIERTKSFTMTEDHLKLAERMYVDWDGCEFGAPSINPKRPYGNSNVIDDIEEITGKRSHKLHKQMIIALQIILCTRSFQVGKYDKKDEYGNRSWELVK